jgi:hypothetical protein
LWIWTSPFADRIGARLRRGGTIADSDEGWRPRPVLGIAFEGFDERLGDAIGFRRADWGEAKLQT